LPACSARQRADSPAHRANAASLLPWRTTTCCGKQASALEAAAQKALIAFDEWRAGGELISDGLARRFHARSRATRPLHPTGSRTAVLPRRR